MTCSSPCCSIVFIHHHHWHLRLAPHHLHPVLQYRSHDNGSNPLGESLQHPAASANLAPTATELTRMSYNKPPAHRRSQWCEPRGVKGVVPSLIPNTDCVILYTEVMYIICYMCTVNIKLSYIMYNYNWYHLVISCVSIKIMWNQCASIKLSNLQTINAQSSSVRPQLPGLQRLRQVGLGFPDIRSCLSKAMQHSICTILWCILEAWPTSPKEISNKKKVQGWTRLDQAAQIAS